MVLPENIEEQGQFISRLKWEVLNEIEKVIKNCRTPNSAVVQETTCPNLQEGIDKLNSEAHSSFAEHIDNEMFDSLINRFSRAWNKKSNVNDDSSSLDQQKEEEQQKGRSTMQDLQKMCTDAQETFYQTKEKVEMTLKEISEKIMANEDVVKQKLLETYTEAQKYIDIAAVKFSASMEQLKEMSESVSEQALIAQEELSKTVRETKENLVKRANTIIYGEKKPDDVNSCQDPVWQGGLASKVPKHMAEKFNEIKLSATTSVVEIQHKFSEIAERHSVDEIKGTAQSYMENASEKLEEYRKTIEDIITKTQNEAIQMYKQVSAKAWAYREQFGIASDDEEDEVCEECGKYKRK